MLKINKKVEYALMALKYMSQKCDGELTSAREVCDTFGTPFDTTAKVMQALNNAKILSSVKGIKGGYELEKSLNEVSYMQLVQLIEGKRPESMCLNAKGLCELHDRCNIITPVDQLNNLLTHYLETLTLDELFNGNLTVPVLKDQSQRETLKV